MGTHFKFVIANSLLKALVNKDTLEGRLACWAKFFWILTF